MSKREKGSANPERVKTGKGGYCDPPVDHQFKKGQSGNPKGRPKGRKPTKSFGQLVHEALHETVDVNHKGELKRMSKMELGSVRLANDFVEGKFRAQKIVPQLLNTMDFDPDEYSLMKEELRDLKRLRWYFAQCLEAYERAREANPYLDLPSFDDIRQNDFGQYMSR